MTAVAFVGTICAVIFTIADLGLIDASSVAAKEFSLTWIGGCRGTLSSRNRSHWTPLRGAFAKSTANGRGGCGGTWPEDGIELWGLLLLLMLLRDKW